MKKENNKAITLIALVITIIILLILASVSIIILTGENGILTRAKEARQKSDQARAAEEVQLAIGNLSIEENQRNLEQNEKANVLENELKNSYAEQKTKTTVSVLGKGFLINHRGYQFEIDDNYKVSYKKPFDAEEWDKTACLESSFLWESDDPNSGEAYHTIIGYADGIANEVKLKIPSRCHIILGDTLPRNLYARLLAQKFNTVELPDTLQIIGPSAFVSFSMQSITIPSSVTEIGDMAFSFCGSLLDINISSGIKHVGKDAFYRTAWLNNQPDGEIYIGKILLGYKGTIPNDYNLNIKEGTETIADEAFHSTYGSSDYDNLLNIVMPNSLTSIGKYSFRGCTNLTNIVMPDSVTSIGEFSFSDCRNLSDIKISDNLIEIGSNALTGTPWHSNLNDGLIYLGKILYKYKGTMPDNYAVHIKEGTKTINSSAFAFYENLSSIEIPDSVETIKRDAFYRCENLSMLSMSKNVTEIGEAAFAYCTSLSNIIIWQNVNKLGYRTFQGWESAQTINLGANKIPTGWDSKWNYECNANVMYAYTGE